LGDAKFDFILAAYHATSAGGDKTVVRREVSHLGQAFDAMYGSLPGEFDLIVAGDFNLSPADLGSAQAYDDVTGGTGSTLDQNAAVTEDLNDHLVVFDREATAELLAPAAPIPLDSMPVASADCYASVSDHLPIVATFQVGTDDDDPEDSEELHAMDSPALLMVVADELRSTDPTLGHELDRMEVAIRHNPTAAFAMLRRHFARMPVQTPRQQRIATEAMYLVAATGDFMIISNPSQLECWYTLRSRPNEWQAPSGHTPVGINVRRVYHHFRCNCSDGSVVERRRVDLAPSDVKEIQLPNCPGLGS
jgi:hypothetical protein